MTNLATDPGILVRKRISSGEMEAASVTDVQLTSLADLKSTVSQALGMA
jgi:hypothetical protein